MEVFILVEKKPSLARKVVSAVLIVLLAYCVLGMVVGATAAYMSFAAIIACILWFVKKRYTEYEYSFFDGDMRFTKIINKSKRKKGVLYNMDETVMIAPSGDRSVYNYENGTGMKVRDFTTGNKDAKVYVMVAKGQQGMELVRFEPDEELLDAICRKYAQKVKR